MMKEKFDLIPRYYWDYHLSTLIKQLAILITRRSISRDHLEEVFGQKPVFTTSGRTSLYVILKSLNLPEGSGVGVPLFCCPVVFDAIVQADLLPIFIDINLTDYTISVDDLIKKKRLLSALIVVHMFGHPADMDAICSVCSDIPVIEDCAQSLFSKYKGRLTGSLSRISFFSFRTGKYVSAGEGSAIFCEDPILFAALKKTVEQLGDWNVLKETIFCLSTFIKSMLYHRPWYGILGYPIGRKLDRTLNLSAKTGFKPYKIAKSHLKTINDRIQYFHTKVEKQRNNSLYMLEVINKEHITLPLEKNHCYHNYYQFAIRFQSEKQRDFTNRYLFNNGIDSAKYLSDIVDIARSFFHYQGGCENTELCSKTILIIPNYYALSKRKIEHVVYQLNEALEHMNNA